MLPLAEAAVEVYRRHARPGKRLKHAAEDLGREQLAAEIHAEWQERAAVPVPGTTDGDTVRSALAVPVFAGELPAPALRALADAAATDFVADLPHVATVPLPSQPRGQQANVPPSPIAALFIRISICSPSAARRWTSVPYASSSVTS